MYKETNLRLVVKGVSWRFVATATTIVIVYLFFGRLDLAVMAGIIETVLKVALYWIHEKFWQKIRWAKKRIKPFNLWFTGLPLSGKSTIADRVYEELKKFDIPMERIDSKDIRVLIPDIGFDRSDRIRHLKRIGHLIKTLQNNSVSTVVSFVSPYKEARDAVKDMTQNYIEIYVKASIESCKQRDYKGVYEKALNGELKNFTGISDIYEEPQNADLIIDTENEKIEESVRKIVDYIRKFIA